MRDVTDDAGMTQAGESTGFSLDPGLQRRAIAPQDLERDGAGGETIPRAEDLSHAPRAGEMLDLEPSTDHIPRTHEP